MHKWHISPPEFIYLDLKCQRTPETRNEGFANLIIYGVKGFQPDVDSSVYDSPFIFENQKMVMETDLDMNHHRILNGPKPRFLISGLYVKPKKNEKKLVLFQEQKATFTLLPVNAKLLKVALYILSYVWLVVTLKASNSGSSQKVSGTASRYQSYDFHLNVTALPLLVIKVTTLDTVSRCFLNLYFEET